MSTALFDLSDRVALVTGASRGIGEEIAKLLAEQGAHVIVSSRKIDGCRTVADRIKHNGGSAEPFSCHVGEMEQIDALMEHVRATHGRLDILVNNAAANPYFGHILDTPVSAFDKTVDVNLRGYFYMTVGGARIMKEHGGGAIVNTASINGITPGDQQGVYSISKAAVINMTKAFALECAEFGIRVNALVPGLTRTQFAGALFDNEAIYNAAMARIPMHRHAEPSEMAGTALYLVSDAATYVTGECVAVDGGFTI